MSTPTERGDLAERMLPLAAKLACIAHGDGDWRDVEHITAQLDRAELVALTVVLGGLVDPGQRIDDALGYITWDEQGRPAPALAHGRQTIRGLAKDLQGPIFGIDAIRTSERVQRARRLYLHDQLTVAEVAREVHVNFETVKQWIAEGGWKQAPAITDADARRAIAGRGWRDGRHVA